MWLQQIEQLTVAGAINGSFYALLGVGFGLILGVTGRFHYAFALVFTFAAYVTSVMESAAGLPAPLAVIAGLAAAAVLGVGVERLIYRPLAMFSGPLSLLTVFISSLGITIAGVNLITLAWSAGSRSLRLVPVVPLRAGDVTFTTLDLALVASAWILIAALAVILTSTDLGRSIRAVRGNPVLARIMGTDPGRIYLAVFAIGSVLCGVAGIFNGARFAVLPDMGDRPRGVRLCRCLPRRNAPLALRHRSCRPVHRAGGKSERFLRVAAMDLAGGVLGTVRLPDPASPGSALPACRPGAGARAGAIGPRWITGGTSSIWC